MKTITSAKLAALSATADDLTIIDVMTPEDYAERHLPEAINACIYEMVFLERVHEAIPDRNAQIVVYDTTDTTRAARQAAERLRANGYNKVGVLAGGLVGWLAEGLPLIGTTIAPAYPSLQDGRYELDISASHLEWTGRNINNRHLGTIGLQSGWAAVCCNSLGGGVVTLDMTQITNRDLADPGYRALLESHLKSADFFDVERYPTGTVTLTAGEPVGAMPAGTVNYRFRALLTLKGITHDLEIPAVVEPQADGSVKVQATFAIDRTRWDVTYGSGRFFERLGMHLVHDEVGIDLFLIFRPVG
jgi:rhodanese-related sulfurtransferase